MHEGTMWAHGHHFRVASVDLGKETCDCGVTIPFDQTNLGDSRIANPIEGQLDYVGVIQEIVDLNTRSFRCVIFKYRWFYLFNRRRYFRHGIISELYCIDIQRTGKLIRINNFLKV